MALHLGSAPPAEQRCLTAVQAFAQRIGACLCSAVAQIDPTFFERVNGIVFDIEHTKL